MDAPPTLGIIGAGKVGSALARLWYIQGYNVRVVASRTVSHAESLARLVNAAAVSPEQAVSAADLIVLTVPDDVIVSLAEMLVYTGVAGKAFIHTSGAHGAEALAALAARGAVVGSLHPAYPFADAETVKDRLRGVTFAVEAQDERLRRWLIDMVASLGGNVLHVAPGQKALYHAALVLASNYTVTLYALAESLLMGIGATREAADGALNGLVGATVENLREQGIPAALTGPLVRSDVGTIAAHLDALRRTDPRMVELYLQLAEFSFPILTARGIAPAAIADLLRQERNNATDNS